MRPAIRILLLALPLWLLYGILCKYAPLRNAIFLEMPQPIRFFRPPEAYYLKSFGASVKAGFAKRDITPPRFSWLAGYYPPHPGIFVNDRLWVKSLALQDRWGSRFVIVSCDLIGLLPDEIEKIKSIVPKEFLLIGATHTHSGPDVMGFWGIPPFTGKNRHYMEFLRKQIVEAIEESVTNLGEGAIRFGQGEFFGYVEGREENLPDSAVSVMQVLLSSGVPITLVNFAAHADWIKSFYVSADFPYYLYERLGRLTGGEVIFIPGAIGGVQPIGDNNSDLFFARTLGEDLADRVYKIMKQPITDYSVKILGKNPQVLNVGISNKKFLWASKIGIISGIVKKDGGIAKNFKIQSNNRNIHISEDPRLELHLMGITIGSAEIVYVPGELFPKIWRRVKSKMKGNPKFIFGLTDGELGYILDEKDFDSGKHPYYVGMSVGRGIGAGIEKVLLNIVK